MWWWKSVTWQTISGMIPPCLTGRLQQDGGTVASSLLGFTRKQRNYHSSPFSNLQGYTMCTPPGLAPLFWLPLWQCSPGSTSYHWTAIVCLLPCLKLKTYGLRPTWRAWTWFGRIVKFIGLWILNPLKTSAGQPVASGGFAVWLGGYFLARLIIFVFVDFRVFYERFVAWFHWSCLFLLTVAFLTEDL